MTKIDFDEPSEGEVKDNNTYALNVRAKGDGSIAIRGETEHDNQTDAVVGISRNWVGIHGISNTNHSAVWGEGKGEGGNGVWGEATHYNGGSGVVGKGTKGAGVYGESTDADGVRGQSVNAIGVHGRSEKSYGVYGHSNVDGVKGETSSETAAGVAGIAYKNFGTGIYGQGPVWAGRFSGSVKVTGNINLDGQVLHGGGDCAEDFDIVEENVDAGTVMVLSETGSLQSSYKEYDKKVAGIISGASGYRPAMVLDRKQSENQNLDPGLRLPVALMGKVYCRVDARHSSIEIGDLLTTSSTKGCAMKAEDPMKAFGSVIGKALGSIKEGIGMIPVLVSLQ
jgi:hypothetical protein